MPAFQGLLVRFQALGLSWVCWAFAGLLSVSGAVVKADESLQSVQDLRYGVALYHFFQQSHFEALTELMVGEQQGDFPHHGDNAELLRGGISLSYGLVDEAESIFNRLLEEDSYNTEDRKAQRDLAWFYLAKLQYQIGESGKARSALARIDLLSDKALSDEQGFMSANLFLREGQMAQAEKAILELSQDSDWLPYYHFNRGVVLTERGEWEQGIVSFRQLQALNPDNLEIKHLKDRAFTAAGYAYLAAGEYQSAQREFSQVRLGSLLVGQALLGHGWAAAQQEDFHGALSPWQVLQDHSLMEASTQESLLAVPFAYEKLDAPGNALMQYEQSAQLFETEIARIDTAIRLFAEAPIETLFAWEQMTDAPVQDWLAGEDLFPVNEYAPYLAYLITRQYFQDRVRQMRELVQLKQFLQRGEHRLALTRAVLEERQVIWESRVEGDRERELEQRYHRLKAVHLRLKQQLDRAQGDADGMLLMEDTELALWEKLEHAMATADLLAEAGKDMRMERSRLQLLRGLLLWDANEGYSARAWEANKRDKQLQQLLAQSAPALESLKQITLAPDDFGFAGRISGLEARLLGQQQHVAQQMAVAEDSIRHAAVAELEQQRGRLHRYMGQARLAIARLHDVGSRNPGPGNQAISPSAGE